MHTLFSLSSYLLSLTSYLLLLFASPVSAQEPFTVLTYNCENAFDTIHDAGHQDQDFLPDGKNHWTRARYFRKMRRIAQVIAAADTVRPADLVILEEVENDTVLTHLIQRTPLKNLGYSYVMTHNHTARGIDVAILYAPRTFQLLGTDEIKMDMKPGTKTDFSINVSQRQEEGTDWGVRVTEEVRPVLHVWGKLATGDTLDVYGLHLPSKLGAGTAEKARKNIGYKVRQHVDSLMRIRQRPLLLLAGDFNDTPRSSVCRKVLRSVAPFKGEINISVHASPYTLYNMMAGKGKDGGSYKWRGSWNWIDQILVSGNLLRSDSPLRLQLRPATQLKPADAAVEALQLPFLLEADDSYRGLRPFRTFFGPRYHGGYSDHLPVVARFWLQKQP